MRKANTIVGLNVIGDDGGDLGKVIDLIFDHQTNKCIGLLLPEKFVSGAATPQILPLNEIAILGKDIIMVRHAESVIQPQDDEAFTTVIKRGTYLARTMIYADDGGLIGTLGDIYLDESTGRVVGYEVLGGFVSDVISDKHFVDPSLPSQSSQQSEELA